MTQRTLLMLRSAAAALLGLAFSALATGADIPVPAPPVLGANSYLLVDFDSGHVLASKDPDQPVEPASITKLMTSYVVFHELSKGNLKLDEMVTISEKAWRTPGSRMFIEVNTQVSVEDLLKGMIIQSGNDASVALAEHIAGSEEVFASLMNQYADQLGMGGTHFDNATGLPAPEHLTTAHDIATLSTAIIREFPELYRWYAIKEFTFNDIRQHNRNTLLWRDPAVDGLKTGHTESAGYCLAASAQRSGMRLVSVVMGTASEKARADETQKLLNYGFRFFETHKLYEAGQELRKERIWKGGREQIAVGVRDDIFVTIPRGQYPNLQAQVDILSVLTAPIAAEAELGRLVITLGDEVQAEAPLLALESVPEGSFWQRFTDSLSLWFHDFGEE